MSRGSSRELPASGTSPSATNGKLSCAERAATMRSQCSSIVTPIPTVWPCTAATSGLPKVASVRRNCIAGWAALNGGPLRKSCRSLPALKDAPSPESSTARSVSSACAAPSAATSCSYMRKVIALRFSGRLRRTSQTASVRETRTGSLMPAACGSNRWGATSPSCGRRPGSTRRERRPEVDVAVRDEPGQRRPGGDVLVELSTVDLVEGVVRGVMDVEIGRAVLTQREAGDTGLHRGGYVRTDILGRTVRGQDPDRGEDAQQRLRELALRGNARQRELIDAVGAEVALPRQHVVGELGAMIVDVGLTAEGAPRRCRLRDFLRAEQHNTYSATRPVRQITDELGGRGDDGGARAVVDRAGALVPAVEV